MQRPDVTLVSSDALPDGIEYDIFTANGESYDIYSIESPESDNWITTVSYSGEQDGNWVF